MNKKVILWIAALIITFLTAFLHQRLSPYYPVSGSIGINGNRVTYVFPKIHYGPESKEILVRKDIEDLKGTLYWKTVGKEWNRLELIDEEKYLKAKLPPMKAGTKAEYYEELYYKNGNYIIPDGSYVDITFKGKRPSSVMNVFYFFLFGGLLLSFRGTLEYFNPDDKKMLFTSLSAVFFFIASIIFYPFIKTYELDVINKTVPEISALFDIPLILIFITWLTSAIILFKIKNKIILPAAGLLTIIIYQFSSFY